MKPEDRWLGWNRPAQPVRTVKRKPKTEDLFSAPEERQVKTRLPLYEPWFPTEMLGLAPTPRDANCSRCSLHEGKNAVCMAPERHTSTDDPRTLLVVYGTPTKDEDRARRAYSGALLEHVRLVVERHWRGSIVYTYGIKCAAGRKAEEEEARACLPYLWQELDDVKPDRVLLLGPAAVQVVTGRYMDATYTRRGHTFVRGTPAFPVMDPIAGAHNLFHRRQFEADVRWALTSELPVPPKGEARVIDTGAELEAFLRTLAPFQPVTIDCEWAGRVWHEDFELLCCALCQDPEHPVVVTPKALLEAREAFTDFLADPLIPKVNQTIKEDRQALYRWGGVDMRGIEGDTELEGRLFEPEALAKLGAQAWLVGYGGYKEAAKDSGDEDQKGGNFFASMHPNDLHAYSGRDGAATLLIHRKRRPMMRNLEHTWRTLIGPAFDALAVVERNGMLPSPDTVRAYDRWLEEKQTKALEKLRSIDGVPDTFNHASSQQKAALLYDTLKLPAPRRSRTTEKAYLETLKDKHPVVGVLMDLSKLDKQRSTYGLNMLNHVSPLTGRIHTRFGLVKTTRLSSREPNLQNITNPRDSDNPDDLGTWARSCFIAPPGYTLVALDYSQQELRVAAMLSGDEKMAAAFESGVDFHTMTAAGAYKIAPELVTKAQRAVAKALNFAIVFGQTDFGIAKAVGIPVSEAQKLMGNLLGKYDKLGAWRQQQIQDAQTRGGIAAEWTNGGLRWYYRRDTANIVYMAGKDSDQARRIRKHWQNVALNSPIQCIANWFSLASITAIVDWCAERYGDAVRVVMSVHDEILLEVPNLLVEEVAVGARRIMLQWPSGCVKLKVEVEKGTDWGHMEELKVA